MKGISLSGMLRHTGRPCWRKLTLALLMLSSVGCSSKRIVCQPPEIPAWMLEEVPLELNLKDPLFEALSQ